MPTCCRLIFQTSPRLFTATSDPKKPYVPPSLEEIPPHLNFAPLENAADALAHSAQRYEKALAKAREDGGAGLANAGIAQVNRMLFESERKLTAEEGLPVRPWFKHLLYAPGLYTGYGVKTVPGVREAIEQKKWKQTESEISRVAAVIEGEAAWIDAAAAKLAAAH